MIRESKTVTLIVFIVAAIVARFATKPEIPEDSYGTYEFLVKVNSQGEIEKITTKTRGIGLEAENIFKKLIQNLDFTPNKSNLPAFSEGTITFRVVPPKKK